MADIATAFEKQNKIVDAGAVETQENRIRIAATGSFISLQEIENLTIVSHSGEHFRLSEVAKIQESYAKPTQNKLYVNNTPGIGLAISTVPDGNVVNMARDVKTCIEQFKAQLPEGYHISNLYDQGQADKPSVNSAK